MSAEIQKANKYLNIFSSDIKENPGMKLTMFFFSQNIKFFLNDRSS